MVPCTRRFFTAFSIRLLAEQPLRQRQRAPIPAAPSMISIRRSTRSDEPGRSSMTEAVTTGVAMLGNGHGNTPFPVRPSSRARRRVRRVLPRPQVLRAVVTGRSYNLPSQPLHSRFELGPYNEKAQLGKQLARPTFRYASSEGRLVHDH